ncbi:MAG: hypothetical protein ACE5FH_00600 [Candidatus Zixiibacteriota bacterium]
MFIWCGVLFFLGILAFMDSIFNMGEIFRQVNSVLFMLISIGLLLRTTTKMKLARRENYASRIFSLEQQVKILKSGKKKLQDSDQTLA